MCAAENWYKLVWTHSQESKIGRVKLDADIGIEYALNAVSAGITALAIKTEYGVVLATEKVRCSLCGCRILAIKTDGASEIDNTAPRPVLDLQNRAPDARCRRRVCRPRPRLPVRQRSKRQASMKELTDTSVLVDRARKVSHTNYKRIYNQAGLRA